MAQGEVGRWCLQYWPRSWNLVGRLLYQCSEFIRKQTLIQKYSLFHSKLRCFALKISIGGSEPKPAALFFLVTVELVNINAIQKCESQKTSPWPLSISHRKINVWREDVTSQRLPRGWGQSRTGPGLQPKHFSQQITTRTFHMNHPAYSVHSYERLSTQSLGKCSGQELS